MAVIVHPVHRKLAKLYLKMKSRTLTLYDISELSHLFEKNAELVQEIDGYKEAAYTAQCSDQMDLVEHFSSKLDEMEAKYS